MGPVTRISQSEEIGRVLQREYPDVRMRSLAILRATRAPRSSCGLGPNGRRMSCAPERPSSARMSTSMVSMLCPLCFCRKTNNTPR